MTRTLIFSLLLFLFQLPVNKVAAQDTGSRILYKNNTANFYSSKVVTDYQSTLSARFTQWETIKIASAAIASTLAESRVNKINIGLQINDETAFNVTLEKSELVANDYILTTQTPQGKITANPHPDYFYKGKVNDKDGGDVRLCIKEGFIYGFIRKGKKEYFIEPLNRYNKAALKDEFIFYEAKDVISTTMTCGFNDAQAATRNIASAPSQYFRPALPDSTGSPVCKKIKFLIASDYSMFRSLNNDIDVLQTFLLANLNMAEGLFNTLNFDSTIAGDAGADLLKFEVTQMHTSVCDSCDFLSATEINTNTITSMFSKWLDENTNPKQAFINEFWTTRHLGIGSTSFLGIAPGYKNYPGCFFSGINILRYVTQAPITLRLQVSHEAGHSFGCVHDNDVSPSVTAFIMNAGGTYSATPRFSRLPDFGGINYSSQQTINKTIYRSPCFEDCSPPACEGVTGLKINYYNSRDSTKISWDGSGNYLVKYKIKDTINYVPADQYLVSGNEIILKQLASCTNYTVQVQKVCTGNHLGKISSISFNSSPFTVTTTAVNIRGDEYDLKMQVECKNCDAKNVTVNADHHPYNFYVPGFPATVIIPDLFADGATHRLDFNGDNLNGGCKTLQFYKAPYYRANSIKILSNNFDSCIIGNEWKDSALKTIDIYPSRKWGVAQYPAEINILHGYPNKGNFDSSCMLYNGYGIGIGALISPAYDVTKLDHVYLSFDYKYLSYIYIDFTDIVKSSFKVQVFNGSAWVDIFSKIDQTPFVDTYQKRKIIWDTILPRVFIKLDKYINEKFRVRFVVDDGAVSSATTASYPRSQQLLYIDNIKVDGYERKNNVADNSFSIFPNPANNDLFIKMNDLPAGSVQYKITDLLGRVLQREKLINYRVNTNRLNKGTYFITLFKENKQTGKTAKFIKN